MDEINKRVLSVMQHKNLSKSSFAAVLDVSLPVLTHIGSGRNKPGLEMIQKILQNFQDISPDWLILGNGSMYREKEKKVNLDEEINALDRINAQIPLFIKNSDQISEYHKLLLKEILYLKELSPYLNDINQQSKNLNNEINQIKQSLESKLK